MENRKELNSIKSLPILLLLMSSCGEALSAAANIPTASLRTLNMANGDDKVASYSNIYSCISNSTHCGWMDDNGNIVHEEHAVAKLHMKNYLHINMMPYDKARAQSLGFNNDIQISESNNANDVFDQLSSSSVSRVMTSEQTNNNNVDGLSDGVVNSTIFYSLQAKTLYPWADYYTKQIYMEYVVPYAVTNEPRSDHRPLLFNALRETLKDYERKSNNDSGVLKQQQQLISPEKQVKEVVKLINTRLCSILGRPSQPIVFKAGLTPRIYDPLSVIAYGYSSCTGLAILLVAALRAIGIPSRMAGTPAWYGDADKGNHSWVEVYVPSGKWVFLEPTPGIAEGDEDTANADDLDRDPCKRWFCNKDRFNGSTKVFATRYTKDDTTTHYPMAWSDPDKDDGVPGEDRTDYYTSICGQCPH